MHYCSRVFSQTMVRGLKGSMLRSTHCRLYVGVLAFRIAGDYEKDQLGNEDTQIKKDKDHILSLTLTHRETPDAGRRPTISVSHCHTTHTDMVIKIWEWYIHTMFKHMWLRAHTLSWWVLLCVAIILCLNICLPIKTGNGDLSILLKRLKKKKERDEESEL